MDLEAIYRKAPGWVRALALNAYALKIEWHRYGRRYRRATRELLERERWDPARMRSLQDEALRRILRTAAKHSEFHRHRWAEAGVGLDDVRGVGDLPRLPLLEKEMVRANQKALMTEPEPGRGWLHGHTSGTTGTPLGLWYDRRTCIMTNAVDRRQKIWGGMRSEDWIGLLLGRVVVPLDESTPPFWGTNRVQRQVWFSSFHMSEENLPAYIAEIRRRGLRFLEGYPSTLFILAQYLDSRGEALPMTAVFSSSETLHDVQRSTIESAFACRLFDFYGHAERTIFATECEEHEGKHISEEYGWVEIVDAEGRAVPDGETGFLTGTSLVNEAMPMIRYRTSDVSRIVTEPCACGRTSRRISGVTTKAEDIIVGEDGRFISPSVLTHPFKPLEGLMKSQIIQDESKNLTVKLVAGDEFTAEQKEALVAGLRERVGGGIRIELEMVDDIPRERSGKYRWVISQVRHAAKVDWSLVDGGPVE